MRSFFFISALVLANGISAQQAFPTLEGETAKGAAISLPLPNPKGYTLIGLAYSQKAQPLLEEWYEPAYLRFVAKHGLFAGAYEVDAFFVPLFVGLKKTAYEPSMRKFRESASPEIVDHVVFSKAELEPLKAALGMADKDIPYFFVLDRQGRIIHRTDGAFTDEKLEAIEDVLLN
ncbi:MAG TPA: hypothetical protein VKG92_04440 [Flavobacteriales bacterium]|nr:hypothetical protein [Flavobacteriales bacterium]